VKLRSVTVGGITQRNVEAMVIDGPHPPQVLLGMSFLERLDMQNDGRVLKLKPKY
jgi:aspartyl protease family protein